MAQASVRQWKRTAQVIVGTGGLGLLIQQVRISFEVNKTVDPVPNLALIKMYNLSPENENKIHDEYDEVILNAGYIQAPKLIFRGNIITVSRYRDGNDRITEIQAGDGDKDYRKATMQATLSAGTRHSQLIDRALSSFSSTIRGSIVIQDKARTRGKVISGNTRDILDDLAKETGSHWSIQDGALQIISSNDVAPGQAIVVTSETGMLGAPEINDKGIGIKTLLNPEIKINGSVKLDNNGIRRKQATAKSLAAPRETAETAPRKPVRLDPDGIYKVIRTVHKGDTRGQEWMTEAECIGLNQPIPESRTENQSVL